MYKQYNFSRQNVTMIFCTVDNMWIPVDEGNAGYQKYLGWVGQGNVAEIISA